MSTKPGYHPIAKGDPRTGVGAATDPRAYFRSLIPPEPRDPAIDLDDPADCKRIFFDPDPETTNKILLALYDPRTSLVDITLEHHTTLEALTLWLAHPEIAARIANLNSAAAQRNRMVATARLLHAVEALDNILNEYNDGACHKAAIAEGRAAGMDNHLRRDRETARKAAALMLRIARFDPDAVPQINLNSLRRARSRSEHPTSDIAHPTFPQITFGPPHYLTTTTINLPPVAPSEPAIAPSTSTPSVVSAPSVPPVPSDPATPPLPAHPIAGPSSPHAEGVIVYSRGLPTDGSAEVGTPGTQARDPAHAEGVLGAPHHHSAPDLPSPKSKIRNPESEIANSSRSPPRPPDPPG